MRLQLALNVSDLDESIDFYKRMFATEPAKIRDGYANFEIADPPLKLVLFEGAGEGEGELVGQQLVIGEALAGGGRGRESLAAGGGVEGADGVAPGRPLAFLLQRRVEPFGEARREVERALGGLRDVALVEALREWRLSEARRRGLPAF